MTTCEVNQIFLGEVATIQNYGAFIRIPGCSQQGLIHRTQISSAHVDDVAEILQRGERVWCKVISISEDGKIGLSMKHVNQGNGADLDPNGIELQRDMQKKKSSVQPQKRKAIHLEAVLNTTCTKCGTHGHLSNDCFMPLNGKKYELIPEIEELEEKIEPIADGDAKEKETDKKQKAKKLKKRKKSKKSKQRTDENASEEESGKKRKKKKSKDRKQKKKKYEGSSSDTGSDGSTGRDVRKRKHSYDPEVRILKKCKHSKVKSTD